MLIEQMFERSISVRHGSFTHLHVASALSMRYGTTQPAQLVERASELGLRTLALTDRDTVAGAVSFLHACASANIAPILGADLAIAPQSTHGAINQPTPAAGGRWMRQERPRITVLAHDQRSWAGLCAAISLAHQSDEPMIVRSDLMRIAGEYGLRVMLGATSDVGLAIAARRPDRAMEHLAHWHQHDIQPYLEIVTHAQPVQGSQLSDTLAARMLQWAIAHRAPAVLSNAVRFLDPHQSRIAQVLDAARQQVSLESHTLHSVSDQAFLASSEHMQRIAERISTMVGDPRQIAHALLRQTEELGERSVIDPVTALGMKSVYVPELEALLPGETRSAAEILRVRCDDGLAEYVRNNAVPSLEVRDVRERLERELNVINTMGYAGFVLTVAEVVDMIKRMGIRVAARGSGAGSFISHVLGISGVDPIRHNLLMERFVSTLRPGLPDIDIDVESARRTEIYDAIFERFGSARTTCVSMRETYRVRHAIRDVGSALGMPQGDINTFAKSFPHIRARQIRSALHELPELRRTGLGKLAAQGRLDHFIELVEGLDGLPRHMALHPCGVILSDSTLLSRTPVQPSAQGYSMTQFDKDDVEHMGLLKLDVLGVRMQSALAYAVDEVARVEGASAHGASESGRIDLERVPQDDAKTFELIQSTRTLGCFQIESPGQRELIGKFAPTEFGDLIIDISLFRPGPVKSDMITPFLRARQGWAIADYIHKDLLPVLEETCGVVVFHEQVMRMISTLTKCSLEYADLIRRRLGSREHQDGIREWFYLTAKSQGYELSVVEEAWEVLRAFASFGFCKAHAAAFALPTYQSAWFKAHHPAAFLAGVLTHDPGMYPKRLLVDDARAFGISVLGLDINRSDRSFRVERLDAESDVESDGDEPGYGIRIALEQVKGISDGEVAAILEGQPYASLADFVQRGRTSRPIVEKLILAGAFDGLHGHQVTRRDLLLHLVDLEQNFKLAARGRTSLERQITFGMDFHEWQPTPTGLAELKLSEQVAHEMEILGIDVSAHVISFYDAMLRDLDVVAARQLLEMRSHARILIAGAKVSTQTPPIRSGKRVAFVTIEDSTGPADAAFFEDALAGYAPTIFHSWLLLVAGKVRRTGPKGVSIIAEGCWALADVYQVWKSGGAEAVFEFIRPVEIYDETDAVTPTKVWEHASGIRTSPFADVRPAGA